MKMILRWFPFGDDSVTLKQIRQIPGVEGVATCLPSVPVGETWPLDTLRALRRTVNEAGLTMEVIESVNIHEDIKKGLATRDRYIDAYIETLKNLAQVGVKCLCYNFMPVIDWVRSDVAHPLPDGSAAMAYRHDEVLSMNPIKLAGEMAGKAKGYSMPGWEPERLGAMAADMDFYQTMPVEDYWKNIQYFLDAVVPRAAECGIKMAIHPDDPPWPLYGLPKLITNAENVERFLHLHESEYNGLTFCTGSLGSNVENDLPAMIRAFGNRIHFAHVRNIKHYAPKDFDESAHLSDCGDLDMFAIMMALYESGFDGYIRPDHGRMIWDETARPGYGLYDRALGSNYLHGLWEAIRKMKAGGQ